MGAMRLTHVSFVCCLALLAHTAGAQDLDRIQESERLRVTLEPDPASGTLISLDFIGDADGQTTLSVLPDWGGTTTEADWFHAFDAAGHAGQRPAAWDASGLRITIEHEPDEPIRFTYRVRGLEEYNDVDDYAPLMTEDGIAFFTSNTLLLPERWFTEDQTPLAVSYHWDGLNELSWQAYPTFSGEATPLKPDRLREGMIVAGSFRSASFEHGDSRFHVVELGENASFTPETLASYAKPMLSGVHDFVDDHAPSDYVITYAPAGEPVENGFALGGTAVTNAFAFYFDPSVNLDENEGLAEVVTYVLCHEYVHNWNGILFWMDEPDFEHQSRWFIEGFTDFITRRSMLDSGLRDAGWYRAEMERVRDEYQASPYQALTNEQAAPRWIAEPEVSDMLYRRGELIALLIDQRVRESSGGKLALRDYVRSLVRDAKRGQTSVQAGTLLRWVEQHTDAGFRESIERMITEGGEIPFPGRIE